MKGYSYNINRESFTFSFVNETGEKHEWKDKNKWSHYKILNKLIKFMRGRGFKIENDKKVNKLIRADYWYGIKENLEFVLHRYPNGFSFDFYQNINFKNPNGGRYDFDKFDRAPYMVKLMFINESKKMLDFLQSLKLDIDNHSEVIYKLAEDKIKSDYVESWHYPHKDMDFNLSDLDGQTCESRYNNTDRDGKTICNGDIKYFRDYGTARLNRGKVYRNLNNMWWVIVNNTTVYNVADFNLFNPTEEDFKDRRKARNVEPKEYIKKNKALEDITTRALIKELKRRGVK